MDGSRNQKTTEKDENGQPAEQVINAGTVNKRDDALTIEGIRFEFPYWDLLPQMTDERDELITKEMRKSVDVFGLLEPVTIILPADGGLEIVDQELRYAHEQADVIDVGGSVPENQALASTNFQPTVKVFHGEVRL